jgi:hypothetical protein
VAAAGAAALALMGQSRKNQSSKKQQDHYGAQGNNEPRLVEVVEIVEEVRVIPPDPQRPI